MQTIPFQAHFYGNRQLSFVAEGTYGETRVDGDSKLIFLLYCEFIKKIDLNHISNGLQFFLMLKFMNLVREYFQRES